MKYGRYIRFWFLVFAGFYMFSSCLKFRGEQEIPAYIKVDSFNLVANPLIEEGVLTQNISDVWVFVDGKSLGCFELPTVIPVLESGNHQLILAPGVIFNGISGTRGQYPYLKPYKDVSFNFIIDSVITVTPVVHYYDNTVFTWIEDFEDGYVSLEPTNNSDTSIQQLINTPTSPLYGHITGIGYLDNERRILECATNADQSIGFELPASSIPVFLEMDYNTNNHLSIGMFVQLTDGQLIQYPMVIVNPSGEVWKKIYINFTPLTNRYHNAAYYNIFVRADKFDDVSEPVVKFDNFKLLFKDLD
jgi:hypothetical protein